MSSRREANEARLRQELVTALGAKKGEALAVSSYAIVDEAAMRSKELSPELRRKLTEALVANYDSLPAMNQGEVMESRWEVLDRAATLPLLRRVAERYRDFPELREVNAWSFNRASAGALKRWYEVEPEAAREAIVAEIVRPKPRFDTTVLGILPDKELPEVDTALGEHLRSKHELDVAVNIGLLIHRYASRAIEPQVLAYLDQPTDELFCGTEEPLVAYLFKHDPATARSRVEAILAARGNANSACYQGLLTEVGKLQNDPWLESVAIRSLDDPEPEVVANAAEYLGEYGSARAEEILWSHLIAWNQQWRGRETEFQWVGVREPKRAREGKAGSNMIQALAAGQSWLANDAKLLRLMELSLGQSQRGQVEQYLRSWQAKPWQVFLVGPDQQFEIAQYRCRSLQAAKSKLRQFPKGSKFQWSVAGRQKSEETLFDELSKFAASFGIEIARNPGAAR